MNGVNEKSTAYLTVTFKDKNGMESVPASATWKVHDKASGQELMAETEITPAATVEITLPPSVNTLVNASKIFETRVVTVEALFGENDGSRGQYEYQVNNLQFVT